jgi:hypothetical protein
MRVTALFFAIYLISTSVNSQVRVKTSLLWKISGNSLKEPSYIFGTFHLMCKDQFTISDTLKATLLNTTQFYGELDMDDPTMQQQMMQLIAMPNRTLESYMTAEKFRVCDSVYKTITGMSLKSFNQFKPFMSVSFLTIKTVPCSNFVQPETELMNLAKANKKEILGLETVAEQLNAIDMEPIDSQVVALRKIVLNFDSTKATMKEMMDVYQKKDPELLFQYIQKQGKDGVSEKALLVDRNKKWAPKMKSIMQEKSSFFAVGAGHLGGKTGVLALLRELGYRVEPIQY